MRTDGPVLGEHAPSKVAALFGDHGGAEAAAARLRRELGLDETQVRVISPGDPHPGRKIEPDDRGIWHTAIKAHVTLGLLGLMAGLVLFGLLWAAGITAVRSSPWAAGGAVVMFGAVFGLLAGGLVTLRPDHDKLIVEVREAVAGGRHAVITHPVDRGQRERSIELLAEESGEVLRTL